MRVLGIDIGGSGIKAAPVDVARGCFLAERIRYDTPQPATPKAVARVIATMTHDLHWRGPIGCTFPAIIRNGVAESAAHVDPAWIGTHVDRLLTRVTGSRVVVLNDADAAGLAEMRFGAGRGRNGVVIVLTIGTGIGSALFIDGQLVLNTELGHLEWKGGEAEKRLSDWVRREENLTWKRWARRLDAYLRHLELVFSPDLIILGGGVSRKSERFLPRLTARARVVPARLRNDAGIVGAALVAATQKPTRPRPSTRRTPKRAR